MNELDPAVRDLIGEIDYDPADLQRRYEYERDVRLRPDRNKQYIESTAEFSHYADDPYVAPVERPPLTDHVAIAVIGGGMGGLVVAAKLREAGHEDIRIIEKGGDFGGTWYWNRYPGIRCDTESLVYLPMLEQTGSVPSEKYVRGSEIRAHLLAIAAKSDLYRNACLQTGVTGVAWNDAEARWHIHTDRGDDMTAHFVVLSNGLLVRPKLPGIPGISDYKGHTFHTSRWDYDYTGGDEKGGLSGLADKTVGVIGTGATGVQVIPPLAASAKHLYVFQRTPAAVDYRANEPTDRQWFESQAAGWQDLRVDNFNHVTTGRPVEVDLVNDKFSETGKLRDAAWAAAKLKRELSVDERQLIVDTLDDKMMNRLRDRIDAEIMDPATADALKPWHRRWCKRPLFSDDYLSTFNRPNVTLVDTSGAGIERMTEKGVVVAGKEYQVDCLIFATGFETGTEFTHRAGYDVVGRGGLELSDYWKDGMKTFHGMFARGFPNCFIMGSGQGASAVAYSFPLQEQAKHIAHVIVEAGRRGAATAEPSEQAVADYLKEVKPMSVSQRKFWLDCTPSYMNDEGASNNRHGFYANAHPAGTVDFYRTLAAWRQRNELVEIEFRQGAAVEVSR